VRNTYRHADDRLEIVEMNDMVTGDWATALQGTVSSLFFQGPPWHEAGMSLTTSISGVDAVVHVAALLFHPSITSQQIYEVRSLHYLTVCNSMLSRLIECRTRHPQTPRGCLPELHREEVRVYCNDRSFLQAYVHQTFLPPGRADKRLTPVGDRSNVFEDVTFDENSTYNAHNTYVY